MRRHLPDYFFNVTSLIGAVMSVVMLGLIVSLFLVESLAHQKHPYMGILTFIVLPMFLIVGLLLIFVGAVRARRRARAGLAAAALPRIDLNNPLHRRSLAVFGFGSLLFIALSGFGSFQAYEQTETVEFCGTTCHKVMQPEYTAYQASPHARVACVECHIGSGATWFVRSKISGSYQVYSTLFNKYPRPIATPIHNLRPAKETCEQCHWPRQFYSAKVQNKNYYLPDAQNTHFRSTMLINIGGGDPQHGAAEGIHAHMYIENKISYIATDKSRQVIPYVVSVSPDGKETVYRSTEVQASDADLAKGEHRTVDCIDCHNRPTHIYHNPSQSVNQAMALGQIPTTLPEVKKVAVDSLEGTYKDEAAAQAGIQKAFTDFYQASYPKIAATRAADIQQAVQQTEAIYSLNYFPQMKVSWKGFPNNIGHLYSDGCFRCHDGKHVSKDGKVISKDCNTCHTIVAQQRGNGPEQVSMKGLVFNHPGDVGDAWKSMNCSGCHGPQAQS